MSVKVRKAVWLHAEIHMIMETNTCNVNHLDADAHLPPRKRLLAGLKRQISDVISPMSLTPDSVESEDDAILNYSFMSQLTNPSLSNEEIVKASRITAMKAAKVAEAARANAEEKAAKAAKAMAAAKSALDLVAILSDEAAKKEKILKKNKMKKHVTVEALYNKNKGNTNRRTTDEELARKLHRDINSSPRILKNSSGSDMKYPKHKKLKSSTFSGRASTCGVPPGEGSQPSIATSNGNGVVGVAVEDPIKKIDMIVVDLNTSKPLDSGEGCQPSNTERMVSDNIEVLDSFGKKRGRIKQKKLPLSICSFRDQSSPKEELKSQGIQLLKDTAVDKGPLFSMGSSGNNEMPIGRASMWKCQSFKAPACVKQNKVVQS
ncbi:hypothetical protein ACS0TY_010285 [Phlomoides rotata]